MGLPKSAPQVMENWKKLTSSGLPLRQRNRGRENAIWIKALLQALQALKIGAIRIWDLTVDNYLGRELLPEQAALLQYVFDHKNEQVNLSDSMKQIREMLLESLRKKIK